MPALSGFSDNEFRTRSDMFHATEALLKPLKQYKSAGGARIKLATATGAGFDEVAAQLEGFSRPLWVIAFLLPRLWSGHATSESDKEVDLPSWLSGLKCGVDPGHPEYWGDIGDFDQRMVEIEAISFMILTNQHSLPFLMDDITKDNLIQWLRQINSRQMPENNWRWFRIFANLALMNAFGVPHSELKPIMDADFQCLDSFYLGEGWSSDGLWGAVRKQADYYSGSFAIQFAQMLYVHFAGDMDTQRVSRYRSEAGIFASKYWRYFGPDGSAIPFGRSLTYRFAFAAFWAAVSLANVSLTYPLDNPGVVKGLLLRHFRWWSNQENIFNTDGTLNIGYTYPNMYLSEDYNSPQSVYWCLKSFLVLGLREDHIFWTCEELPYPATTNSSSTQSQALHSINPLPVVEAIWPPRHIICNGPEHHFLLSSGQSTRKGHKAQEAKYGKFAYSAAFAFSVPTGSLLPQLAPDSTICLRKDDDKTWKMRWEPYDVQLRNINLASPMSGTMRNGVPVLVSKWKPWAKLDFVIETTLIPCTEQYPGWHIRVHKITYSCRKSMDLEQVECIDSGFAISGQKLNGHPILAQKLDEEKPRLNEGWWKDSSSALVISKAGASGIVELTLHENTPEENDISSDIEVKAESMVLKPDANTNLIEQRTLLPAIKYHMNLSVYNKKTDRTAVTTLITGVFAVAKNAGLSDFQLHKLWSERPSGYGVLKSLLS